MACVREQLEQREKSFLAPYAQLSGNSRGRAYPESAPPDWRTHFQRDRDRVIHSRAFRRLEYKTQVFLNGTGDHLRTRLTHTMEVAAISRNIARALALNEDLTETIALAHDLGHSPFGHTGEAVLNRLMQDEGGFEHNKQSLRIVEELEQKYPGFPGLNLSWEVREGLAKHHTPYDRPAGNAQFVARSASLEAQIANLADEIAYYSHDLDDGLEANLLKEEKLARSSQIWNQAARRVQHDHGNLPDECRRYFIIRCIIDGQVKDVVRSAEARIRQAGVTSADEVRQQPEPLVRYSPERAAQNLELREYLYQNLYYSPEVHEPNQRAVRMLEELFLHFLKNRSEIPPADPGRTRPPTTPHRAVCDFISGMTDRSVLREHQRVFPKSAPGSTPSLEPGPSRAKGLGT